MENEMKNEAEKEISLEELLGMVDDAEEIKIISQVKNSKVKIPRESKRALAIMKAKRVNTFELEGKETLVFSTRPGYLMIKKALFGEEAQTRETLEKHITENSKWIPVPEISERNPGREGFYLEDFPNEIQMILYLKERATKEIKVIPEPEVPEVTEVPVDKNADEFEL